MKSEHRHDLQTNVLSAELAKWVQKVKPFSGQIVTGIVLLAVLYAGLAVWDVQSAEKEREAWDAFALATDTSDPEINSLQRVAENEQYAGTKMQEWAYVGWCDRQVLNAMSSYLIDRKTTEDRLRNVVGIYENLASGAADFQVQNRARFGLARVYELQNKLDEARQQYLTVRGDLQPQASDRAKQLESEEVRKASSWLATAELPKRDLTGGQGATGARPNFDASLPVAQPSSDGISAESLEKLLGELNPDSPVDENRYDEKEEAAPTDDQDESDSETETNTEEASTEEASTEQDSPKEDNTVEDNTETDAN